MQKFNRYWCTISYEI